MFNYQKKLCVNKNKKTKEYNKTKNYPRPGISWIFKKIKNLYVSVSINDMYSEKPDNLITRKATNKQHNFNNNKSRAMVTKGMFDSDF